jgi:hypothetical protein
MAAAALIAAQCPGGDPVSAADGPRQLLPVFPRDLRTLAARALDRVSADEWLPGTWVDPADARERLSSLKALRDVLDPPPAGSGVPQV